MPRAERSSAANTEPHAHLRKRTREIWERNAAYWDETIGDGDDLHRQLVLPAVEGLLRPAAEERMLDIACGNGALARHLAALGVHVVACDFAETFVARAQSRPAVEVSGSVEYRVVDATHEAELLDLGERTYDAAVCNMALMDMVAIEPLFWSLSRLLKPGGRFVFSITHPCFNHAASHFASEESIDAEGRRTDHSLRLRDYLAIGPARSAGSGGLPEPQYTFHRPLSDILNSAFNAGLVMDGVAEPAFSPDSTDAGGSAWSKLPGIPPVFAARFRRIGDR